MVLYAAWPFTTELIPAHFGFDGQLNCWGDRSELFILPVGILIFGAIFAIWFHKSHRKTSILLVGALSGLLLFDGFFAVTLASALPQTQDALVAGGFIRLFCALIGGFFIVMGFLIPHLEPTYVIGARLGKYIGPQCCTRVQRFGRVGFIVGGVVEVFASLVALNSNLMMSVTIVIAVLVCGSMYIYGYWLISHRL